MNEKRMRRAFRFACHFVSCIRVSRGGMITGKKVRPGYKKVFEAYDLVVSPNDSPSVFKAGEPCFNESDRDTRNMSPEERFCHRGFKFTVGCFSMNAGDYARGWKNGWTVISNRNNFSLDRDKRILVPYIGSAQGYNPI